MIEKDESVNIIGYSDGNSGVETSSLLRLNPEYHIHEHFFGDGQAKSGSPVKKLPPIQTSAKKVENGQESGEVVVDNGVGTTKQSPLSPLFASRAMSAVNTSVQISSKRESSKLTIKASDYKVLARMIATYLSNEVRKSICETMCK